MSSKPPRPPKDLNPAAAAHWDRIAALLADRLDERDEVALSVLCTSAATYDHAQAQIDEHGAVVLGTTGQPIKNPYCLVLKEAFDRIRPLLAEFGLSPLSRGKQKGGPTDPGEIEI